MLTIFFSFGFAQKLYPSEQISSASMTFISTTEKITEKKIKPTPNIQAAKLTVSKKEIQATAIRSVFPDALAAVKHLPGVVKNGGFDSRIYVRGGNFNELTIVLDDYYLDSPYFFGGMASLINHSLVDNIEFYPSNFPARYGQALSGVIDIKTKTGSVTQNRSELNQSSTDLNYIFEGSIEPNKSSWIVSVRRTYYDWIFKLMMPSIKLIPFYESVETKTFFKLAPGQNLSVHYALFYEKGDVDSKASIFGDNLYRFEDTRHMAHINLDSQWDPNWATKFVLGFDSYAGSYHQLSEPIFNVTYDQSPISLTGEVTYAGYEDHKIITGAYFQNSKLDEDLSYDIATDPDYPDSVTTNKVASYHLQTKYVATYLEDEYTILPSLLSLNTSCRYEQLLGSAFSNSKSFQPRFTLYFGDRKKEVFHVSAGNYYWFHPKLLDNEIIDLYPEKATHYNIGYEKIEDQYRVRGELFYKDYSSLVLPIIDKKTGLYTGYGNDKIGRAGGIELFLQKKEGDFWDGYLTYTYSVVQYKEPDYDWYYPNHDQRHTLNIVGNFILDPNFKICTVVEATTGRPYTDILGASFDTTRKVWIPQKGTWMGSRYPDGIKLDIWLELSEPIWPFNQWGCTGKTYFGMSDVLNTAPVIAYSWNEDYSEKDAIKYPRYPLFGTQINF